MSIWLRNEESVIALELSRVRFIGSSKMLRPFVQRLETWEFLLIVYALSGDGRYGIEDYLDQLQTLKCTRLTMRNFVRDRIAEGALVVVNADKKSRKSLAISEELGRELEESFKNLKGLRPAIVNGRQSQARSLQLHPEIKL